MDWFYDKFLPSLFERTGTGRTKWLTAKQTAECTRRMEPHFTTDASGTHVWYSYYWNGREVTLQYSKLNKCGEIQFYMTEEEQETARREREAERAAIEAARIGRLHRNPSRLQKAILDAQAKIKALEERVHEDREEIQFALQNPASDSAQDLDWLQMDCRDASKKLEEQRAYLEKLTAEA